MTIQTTLTNIGTRPLPFETGHAAGQAGAFERLRHVKRYISGCTRAWAGDCAKLAASLGLKPATLRRLREHWDRLQEPVPVNYLSSIGVEWPALEAAFELDLAEFDAALAAAGPPTTYSVKVMPTVYVSRRFPAGLSEKEAVEHLRGSCDLSRTTCVIRWPGLKAVVVRGSSVLRVVFRPRLEVVAPPARRFQLGSLVTFEGYGAEGGRPAPPSVA